MKDKGSILHRCLNKFSLPDIIGMLVRSSLHWQLVLWIITIMKVLLTSMWRQHFEILCVLQISCWYSIVNNDVKIEELYEKLRQYPEIMKTSPHKNTGDLFYLNQKLNQSCHIFLRLGKKLEIMSSSASCEKQRGKCKKELEEGRLWISS